MVKVSGEWPSSLRLLSVLCVYDLGLETQRPPTETPQRPQGFGVSNFKFQISDSLFLKLRVETDQIRAFVAASSLCDLCVYDLGLETQSSPSETPQSSRRFASRISNFKSEILNRLPIRAFVAHRWSLRRAAEVVPVGDKTL